MVAQNKWRQITVSLFLLFVTTDLPQVLAQNPPQKLGRGAANGLLGWIAYPRSVRDCASWVPGSSMIYLPCAVSAIFPITMRHVIGLTEVVTFPLPWPVSGYGSPYREWDIEGGDYPWSKE